jgi:hypothetical protein
MKKLLSAVTSIVMGASLMTSAFATTVSAASVTAVQPNVSIGDARNVSANNNVPVTKPVSNGDIVFDFGTYTAAKGEKVTVSVLLDSGNSHAVASIDAQFKLDSSLKLSTIGKKSDAYSASVESNLATAQASFTSLEGGEKPTVGTDGQAVFKLQVEIPEDCADGVYNIGFSGCDIFKSGQDSEVWSYSVKGGTITVGNPVTTTTQSNTTTTTTTTTTPPASNADVVLDFQNYTAKPGDKITVDVLLKSGAGAVSSMDATYKIDSPLTITQFGKKSAAYGDASVESNLDLLKQSFISLNGDEPIVGTAGESVFKFIVEVPANAKAGVYNVGFSNLEVYKEGKSSAQWTYAAENGKITVVTDDEPGTTTSATTTTVTTTVTDGPVVITPEIPSVNADADVVFDLGTYTAQAGDKVTLDVLLKKGSVAVASMDVKFKIDSALKLAAIGKKAAAYGNASVESNLATAQASFISLNGSEPIVGTVGDSVFKVQVEVPAGTPDGNYYVSFDSADIFKSGGDSAVWDYGYVGGVITVGDVDTGTTSVTTTTVSTTSSTSTTSTTTVAPVGGTVEWVIPTVEAKPGQTVKMDVLVKNSALEVAGAQFLINAKAPIKYTSVSGSTAYASEIEKNDATQEFAFGEEIGNGIKAADGSSVLTLTYDVPADCAPGTYPVTWSGAFITDTNGSNVTNNVTLTNGAIVVVPEAVDAGAVTWTIDKVTAKPGDTVTLKAVVKNNTADALSVAGAQFNINAKAPIAYTSIAGGAAYDVEFTPNNTTKEFAFANENGAGSVAADGATIFTLTYTVPENCAAGEYPVVWSNQFVSGENGKAITANVTFVDGSITVEPDYDPNEEYGTVEWIIPEVDAQPGDTVEMVVKVKNGAEALTVAGAQFVIDAAAPIVYVNGGGATGYDAEVVPNNTTKEFAFAQEDGKNVIAPDGSAVITLTYKVPEDCAAGDYPVVWSSKFVSAENGINVTGNVTFTNGVIHVTRPTTETTASDTTTTETITTTVSDTSSTSTSTITTAPIELPDGAIAWVIDMVQAEPGDDVVLNVKVRDFNKANLAIAGAQYVIKADAPIEYTGAADGDAYGFGLEANNTTNEYAFADENGAVKAAADESVVMILKYHVPETCASGIYPVKFADSSFFYVAGADGADLSSHVIPVDGAIIVNGPTTVSSEVTTTSTTTTTTVILPEGAIMWAGDRVTGYAGEEVTVNFVVSDKNNVKLPISAAQFDVQIDGNFPINGATGSDAYSAPLEPNASERMFAFANENGATVAADNKAVVVSFKIQIPEGTEPGDYDVDLVNAYINGENDTNITKFVFISNGVITVLAPKTETTTTTTVTTTDTTSTSTETTSTSSSTDTTSSTTSSTTDTTSSTTDTTTSTTTTGDVNIVSSYAEVEAGYGFYFSHDDGKNTGLGFSKSLVKSIKIFDVYDDGTTKERETVDESLINFGDATPASVYDVNDDDFKYDVPVYYGDTALVDKDGKAVTATAYIGVKGDINLDNKVSAVDASSALVYYSNLQNPGETVETVKLSNSDLVKDATDVYDQFAAFLGDVNENEFDAANSSKTKADRSIIAIDASKILAFVADLNDLIANGEVTDSAMLEIWNKVAPERLGTEA